MTEKDNSNFIERFTVRFPDGMRDSVAERAKQNGRSMNSEIIAILEQALQASPDPSLLTPRAATKMIEEVMAKEMGKLTDKLAKLEERLDKSSAKTNKNST
jgi:plasmid stability protein